METPFFPQTDDERHAALVALTERALAVQDACNLSGVVAGFGHAMNELTRIAPELGTDARNGHPVAVMWADKVAQLAGCQALGAERACEAFAWAHDLTQGRPARWRWSAL